MSKMKNSKIVSNLLKFIENKDELETIMTGIHYHFNKAYKECFHYCLNTNNLVDNLQICSLLDYLHDELNTGHWSEVPLCIRHAFTACSFIKCIILLKTSDCEVLKDCLKCVDLGLLLGAPLDNNSKLLTDTASFLSKLTTFKENLTIDDREISKTNPELFEDLKGASVDSLTCPSLESFNKSYLKPQIPVKLTECTSHWPATTKWLDLNYLLQTAGNRTVPIELGSHYVDENWSQKLMTLQEFIQKHFLGQDRNLGYLAQHNLFDQIPELKADISIPEYCCLSSSDADPDINAWFGPAGTVSPLHYDPKNNILTQIFGTKQVLLFSPKDSEFLYPYEGRLLVNTAQVDPVKPDLDKYPQFPKASMFKCWLGPGEMLFIPAKWWHHVTALEKSFSVSFWWN